MLIRSFIEEQAEADVFRTVGVHELARETGLDTAYLSRVKNNKISITLERYLALWKASDAIYERKGKS